MIEGNVMKKNKSNGENIKFLTRFLQVILHHHRRYHKNVADAANKEEKTQEDEPRQSRPLGWQRHGRNILRMYVVLAVLRYNGQGCDNERQSICFMTIVADIIHRPFARVILCQRL